VTVGPIAGLPPIPPMPPVRASEPATRTTDTSLVSGFRDAMQDGLQRVSDLEHTADRMIQDVATGGPTQLHEVMIATAEASIATDMLVQVRDRALEAYHEIMRLQL